MPGDDLEAQLHREQFPTTVTRDECRVCVVCGALSYHADSYQSVQADYIGCYTCRTVRENARLQSE